MTLKEEYQANTLDFITLIESTPGELFNIKVDDATWSVADNVEHIIRSEFGIIKLFNGPEEDTLHDIQENIDKMTVIFLNRDRKSNAPNMVAPTPGDKTKAELIQKFSSNREKTIELIDSQNLDKTCTLYKNPVFGFISRKEWLHFNMAHCTRHSMQIKEVLAQLK